MSEKIELMKCKIFNHVGNDAFRYVYDLEKENAELKGRLFNVHLSERASTAKYMIESKDAEIQRLKARLAHIESEIRPPESDMTYAELLLDEETRHQRTKDKLAHVESEYAKEQGIVDFYGDTGNWDAQVDNESDCLYEGIIIESDIYNPWGDSGISVGGKRARQRIKERKEFECE